MRSVATAKYGVRLIALELFFFFSSRRRHTRCSRDWSSDVCSSDLGTPARARPDTSLPGVLGDANQLIQVFLNLVTNAEQAIREVRESGRVQIRPGREIGRASCRERV